MTLREKVYTHYKQQVNDKIDAFKDMIFALTEDASNDAKSSAGDKHETALSMMHIEQEKLNKKLAECIAQKNILDKIDLSIVTVNINLGSLVQTNDLLVFIATALPKISIDGKTIFAISPQSPLGAALLGSTLNSDFIVNNKSYKVISIFK